MHGVNVRVTCGLLPCVFSLLHSFSSPPLLSTFLVCFSCCFVLVPVAVWMEVLNTSMSPLKTYPPCGFTHCSVSVLPVSPSSPPVITIVTYGFATPSPFTKWVFLSEWATVILLFAEDVCLCKDLCKCLFPGSLRLLNYSVLFLIPVKSILVLSVTMHTHKSVRYHTV